MFLDLLLQIYFLLQRLHVVRNFCVSSWAHLKRVRMPKSGRKLEEKPGELVPLSKGPPPSVQYYSKTPFTLGKSCLQPLSSLFSIGSTFCTTGLSVRYSGSKKCSSKGSLPRCKVSFPPTQTNFVRKCRRVRTVLLHRKEFFLQIFDDFPTYSNPSNLCASQHLVGFRG